MLQDARNELDSAVGELQEKAKVDDQCCCCFGLVWFGLCHPCECILPRCSPCKSQTAACQGVDLENGTKSTCSLFL